ncbi:SGNH/GDSL hydrolase family protein, partial [Lacticaseibacillus paracasei]
MKKFWLGFGLLLLILAAGCEVQHKAAKSSSSAASLRSRKSPSSRSSAAIKQTSMLARLKAKSQTTLVYAPFGDSLSVGLFADSKTSRFTTLFADQLHHLTDKTVTEEGIAEVGKTATNLGVPALPALIAQHPDLITIEFGTNDAVGGATPTALADYRQALTTIVATLQKQTT